MNLLKYYSRTTITIIFACMIALGGYAPEAARAQTKVYPTDITNIAATANGGRVVAVSSTLENDPKYAAENLIDGQVWDPIHGGGSYGWCSNKYDPINMDYVTFGFKDNAVRHIGKIAINPVANVSPDRWAKDIEVQVSNDSAEGPYTVVTELTVRRSPKRQEFLILPTAARFVKLVFRSNWGSDRAVALGEVEMYEAIDTSDPMGQVIGQLEGAIVDLREYYRTESQQGGIGASTVASPEIAPRPMRAMLQPATLELVQAFAPEDDGQTIATAKVNIAAAANGGKVVDFSSTYISDPAQGADPDYGPDKAIDGQVYDEHTNKGTNGWSSQGFHPGKDFITIGFKDDRTKLIEKFTINPAANQSRLRWARSIDVEATTGSAKDGPYESILTLNLRNEPTNQDFFLPHPMEAKYVKFIFTANGPGGDIGGLNIDPNVFSDRAVAIGEIEIYEPSMQGAELQVIINRFSQVLDELKRMHDNGTSIGATVHPTAAIAAPAASKVVVAKIASQPAPKKSVVAKKAAKHGNTTILVHAPLKKNNTSEQQDSVKLVFIGNAT